MNAFVEACRREWRRLGVDDAIANEMAADLSADLDEAAAEGASAEDVVGNGIFDPQSFAAAWAEARGVVGSPASPSRPSGASRVFLRPIVFAVVAGVAVVIAALALAVAAVGFHSSSRAAPGQAPNVRFGPHGAAALRVFGFPGPFADHTELVARGVVVVAAALLMIGVLAVVLAIVYSSPWNRSSRQTPVR